MAAVAGGEPPPEGDLSPRDPPEAPRGTQQGGDRRTWPARRDPGGRIEHGGQFRLARHYQPLGIVRPARFQQEYRRRTRLFEFGAIACAQLRRLFKLALSKETYEEILQLPAVDREDTHGTDCKLVLEPASRYSRLIVTPFQAGFSERAGTRPSASGLGHLPIQGFYHRPEGHRRI
jgi:hypothetical protein